LKIDKFEEIESWKEARKLTAQIYSMTAKSNFAKDYGLKDQIQRASVSVMANIAEGFDSGSKKSFLIFLNYAYRSASEVQSLLYVALDCGYVASEEFVRIFSDVKTIKKLLGGFIQYLKKSNDKTK
jgi:four helix bundle protein